MPAKSNAERQAKLKRDRNAKGQFKKSWWVTLKEESELNATLEKLRGTDEYSLTKMQIKAMETER